MEAQAPKNKQLAAVNEKLAAAKKKMKTLVQQKKNEDELGSKTMSPYRFEVAKYIFVLSDFSMHAVGEYLRVHCELLEELELDRVHARLLAWRHSTSDQDKNAYLLGQGGTQRQHQYKTANKFMKEYSLHQWVSSENLNKGATPPSRTVWNAKENNADESMPVLDESSFPPPLHPSGKKWLQRWRKRWAISIGTLSSRQHLEPQEALLKVQRIGGVNGLLGCSKMHIGVSILN